MTYLAVPIAAENTAEARRQIKYAKQAGAEMLELRTDYLTEPRLSTVKELVGFAKEGSLPVIVTCRDKAQGGAAELPLELRTSILVAAVDAGADFIDCEYSNFLIVETGRQIREALSNNRGARLILSAHSFKGPFENLVGLYEQIRGEFADAIPKLVYTAKHINDCFEAFDLLHNKNGDAIVLCMGQAGIMSRVLAKKLGGFLTFGCLDDKTATATGQITADQLKSLYRWDNVDAETRLFGVIGSPISHSLSPAIFNACFARQKINSLYLHVLLEGGQEHFDEFLDNIRTRQWLGFNGFSVTIPHKANALDYARSAGESLEALAVDIGAVNTLKVGLNGRVSGYNTDYAGAMDALASSPGTGKIELHNIKVAVAGAGGAGRAVVAGLANVGAKITIYNRTVEKAKGLAEEFGCKYASLDELEQMDATVVINCTSVGMYPDVDATPVPVGCLRPGMTVFDTIYNPVETLLLKHARAAGAGTINGVEMFIRQAMAQFKLFTGSEADEDVMRKTVLGCLRDG